jgi:hypothetical protein
VSARVVWFNRVILGFATLIFFLIGFKYILDPVSAAASSGMSLPTAFGLTNMRAGVGGFSLGCALIAATCLASRERLWLGLWFVLGILGPVLIVRLYGVAVDNTLAQSAQLLLPESVLLSLSVVALFVGRSRPSDFR